jgi:acetolactate decarboxylase
VPPYPSLADVLANQTVFHYQDISGTLVGLWGPPDAAGLSSVGFHFHFISDDRTRGGHVLDLDLSGLTARWDGTAHYEVELGTS